MIATDKNISDTFEYYQENTMFSVDYIEYKRILFLYFKFIVSAIIEGFSVSLPAKLGSFRITGTKREKYFNKEGLSILPPDWGRTKKLWARDPEAKENKVILRHTNELTGGVSYSLKWIKFNVPIRNKNFISFKLTRANKRLISKHIKEGKEYEVTNIIK